MRIRLRLLIPLVLAALVPSLVPLPAAASAACAMQTCDNRDPAAMDCDLDGQRLDMLSYSQDWRVWLDYSPQCNAFWGRGEFIGGDGPAFFWNIVLETKSAVPGSPVVTYGNGGVKAWSLMGDSVRLARACTQLVSPYVGDYLCTAWWLPRISTGRVLQSPQGSPSALDSTCPYGERYWAWGVGTSGSWGVTWHVSGLMPGQWYRVAADVRCDGTATGALYDVDDPSGGRHWFRINQLAYDFAPLGSGTWQADSGGNLTVRLSNGQNPNGQVVAAGLTVTLQGGGVHCPCPS